MRNEDAVKFNSKLGVVLSNGAMHEGLEPSGLPVRQLIMSAINTIKDNIEDDEQAKEIAEQDNNRAHIVALA
ncbi:9189_t:CDS:2, partial [Acaulospora colombiana]